MKEQIDLRSEVSAELHLENTSCAADTTTECEGLSVSSSLSHTGLSTESRLAPEYDATAPPLNSFLVQAM
jgi:hypothetical protein